MGELPLLLLVERLVRPRRPVQQSVRDRPQPVRVELRFGCGGLRELRCGFNRDRDGKFPAACPQFLYSKGVNGVRIGVAREYEGVGSPHTDAVFEDALSALHGAGAILVDVSFPHLSEINSGGSEFTVLLNDFKHDLNAYLSTRTGVPITSLADAIAFNNAHAAQEMPFFAQELFDLAQTFSGDLSDPAYLTALARDKVIGGSEGIDAILATNNVQAIVAPTDTTAWPTDLIHADLFIFGSS